MFGTRKKVTQSPAYKGQADAQSGTNRIGLGTKIEGEIISEGTIRIEGEIDGYLESKSRIIIGESGVVKGDIVCESIDISGRVTGKLQVRDILFLKATAVVDGEISTNKLVMESGASFNGNCKTTVGNTAKSIIGSNSEQNQIAKKAV